MLWCVRVMIPVVPLGMIIALLYMLQAGRQLEFRTDDNLVFAVSEEVGGIDPLMVLRGAERQIESLVFDRLFRLDDELVLRAGLAESWKYRQHLSFFFTDEKNAEKAEIQMISRIAAERERRPAGKFKQVKREGLSLSISLSAYDRGNVKEVMDFLTDLKYLPVLKVRLSMKGAVRESWADFKKNAAETGQIKREWIEGDQAVVLFVAGDAEQFLKELRLYYESNLNLDPRIEIVSQASCLDRAEWVVTLREGLAWHDGKPFTAGDVLFSYKELTHPVSASPLVSVFSHVASLRILGERQFAVECREYYAPIAESWQRLPILPAHLLEGKKTAADWEDFFQHPVGTGAFVFDQRSENGEISLKHNKNYFRGVPQQEFVKFKLLKGRDERARGMRTGAIDGLWPTANEGRLMREDGRFQVMSDVFRKQTLLAWNLDRPVFQKTAVRQALAHLSDVSSLFEVETSEGLRLCRGIFYPGSWFCENGIKLPDLDLERGEVLLQGAGWTRDEGFWKNPAGEVLAFKLLVDRDSPKHMKLAGLLVDGWQARGISVEVLALKWTELVADHLQSRDFDAALVSWDLSPGRDQYRVWHSSESGRGGGNIFALRNERVDQLLQLLKTESEAEEVKRLAESLQKKILELQPCLFLTESAESMILRDGAVRLARPLKAGAWSDENPRMTPAGLQNEWLWWRSRKQASKRSENSRGLIPEGK